MLAHSQTIQNLADHLRSKSHEADLASANAPLTIFAYAGIALPSHAYCFFFYACFRSLYFFIFMKLHSASDVFSFFLFDLNIRFSRYDLRIFVHPQWRLRDSNSRPPACKAGALPTELSPHFILAATCSPTPSPVQYHRPLKS